MFFGVSILTMFQRFFDYIFELFRQWYFTVSYFITILKIVPHIHLPIKHTNYVHYPMFLK